MLWQRHSLWSRMIFPMLVLAVLTAAACGGAASVPRSTPVAAPIVHAATTATESTATEATTPATTTTTTTGTHSPPTKTSTSTGGTSGEHGGSHTTTLTQCSGATAGPANLGASFADLPLPSGTIGPHPSKTLGGGDGQFTIWDVTLCAPGAQSAFPSTFAASAKASGWLRSDWFPANSEVEAPCGDLSCWAKDTRYVTLSSANDWQDSGTSGSGVVTFHLRLATPPPAPDCAKNAMGLPSPSGYSYFLFSQPEYPNLTDGFDHIPLPPLTLVSDDSAAGTVYRLLCSAGSPTMVKAFLDTQLRALGWVPQGGGDYKYANTLTLTVDDWSDPQFKVRIHWGDPYNYVPNTP